jgi:hypothetical protein
MVDVGELSEVAPRGRFRRACALTGVGTSVAAGRASCLSRWAQS